jgi:Ulp1 family protease
MARYQRVVFFCHTPAHWALAVAEPATRVVRTFDSLAGRAAGQAVGLTLASFFSRHLPVPPLLGTTRRPWRHHVEECALQPNDFDCGPHTILNLLRAVAFHRDTKWYPGPVVSDFRRRVAAILLSPVEDVTWCARN